MKTKPKPHPMGLRPELVPLDKIHKLPRNAKGHDLDTIRKSIGRFGYLHRIIVNEQTNHLLSGHGRLDSLVALQGSGAERPAGILGEGQIWLVPVDYVNVPEKDEEAAALALNKVQENGGYEDEILVAVLKQLNEEEGLEGTGFSEEEVKAALDPPHLKRRDDWKAPPPKMVWVLVGCPVDCYGERAAYFEQLAKDERIVVEICGGN